ncbi:MAG: TonB-dependent receptor, partial [Melioribacteraceae bacterium]|nr:TonB-dependent receptor [Melioribacteraceae bacterium]
DLIVEPFVKNAGLVEENTSFPNFYDIQAKLTFGPFDGHKFFLNGILSTDGVEIISGKQRTTADSIGAFNVTDNDLAAFAWHYAPSKNLLNKVILSWYKNEGDADFDSRFLDPSLNREDFEEVSTDTLAPYLFGFGFDSKFIFQKYSLEDKFLFFWGTGNEFEAGVGMDFIRTDMKFQFTFDPALQNFINSNPNTRSAFEDIISTKKYNRYRAYINNKFLIGDRIALEPGIRFDHFNIINKGYFSPRVSLSYGLDNLTTLRAQWGIYYQSPGYEKLRDRNILFDFSPKNMVNVEAEFATHYVLGIERWVNSEWKVKLEGYFKDFDDLILPRMETGTGYFTEAVPGVDPKKPEGWTRPVPIQADSLTQFPVNQSQGEAYGIEFLLEKRNISGDNKINGWLSYAYSVAERVEYGRTVPFRFDQRHTLNLVFNYKINDWLDFGARFQYGSGFPYTEPVGVKPRILEIDTNGDFIPDSPEIATRKVSFDSDIRNVIYDVDYGGEENRYRSRRPIYHRLDLRLTAAADYWDLDWDFYLDIINIYNRQNIINYDYYVTDENTLGREGTTMFPILPTIGFNVRF